MEDTKLLSEFLDFVGFEVIPDEKNYCLYDLETKHLREGTFTDSREMLATQPALSYFFTSRILDPLFDKAIASGIPTNIYGADASGWANFYHDLGSELSPTDCKEFIKSHEWELQVCDLMDRIVNGKEVDIDLKDLHSSEKSKMKQTEMEK